VFKKSLMGKQVSSKRYVSRCARGGPLTIILLGSKDTVQRLPHKAGAWRRSIGGAALLACFTRRVELGRDSSSFV